MNELAAHITYMLMWISSNYGFPPYNPNDQILLSFANEQQFAENICPDDLNRCKNMAALFISDNNTIWIKVPDVKKLSSSFSKDIEVSLVHEFVHYFQAKEKSLFMPYCETKHTEQYKAFYRLEYQAYTAENMYAELHYKKATFTEEQVKLSANASSVMDYEMLLMIEQNDPKYKKELCDRSK